MAELSNTIEIEIDGRVLKARPDQTIIQVADEAGIYIPRFCYHKHLSIPANCRMCLVDIEKMPKPTPACAMPVAPGMKISTKSAKTIAAQRAVMEFLLINHPLDCPICDQGGECELQDLSMGYGGSHSPFTQTKHCEADEDLGPLIATEMTRCIKCTRCVRFGDEVAGLRELGLIGRGEDTDVTTYIKHTIHSEVSGNIIDLCPVGALTAKPSRFTARAWELQQAPSISPHDCVGSNLNVHTRYGEVMRVVARENQAINQTWISDRDRYSYTGLYHKDRLMQPMAKIHGEWQTIDWETALQMAAAGLREMIAEKGADQLGTLASPSSTTEEFYLLQKITHALGSPHIDHRLREQDTRDTGSLPLFLEGNITDLAHCDAIVLIGSHIQKEQPLIGVAVRQATLQGAAVIVINSVDHMFNFKVTTKHIVAPQDLLAALQSLPQETALAGKKNIAILLGATVAHHPDAACLRQEAVKLAKALQAKLGILTEGANSAGAFLAGAVAKAPGLNAYEMLAKPRAAYLLLNVEPEDCISASLMRDALSQAKFVMALATFKHDALLAHANVILPVAPFTETAGTFVNVSGTWQSFQGVATPYGESRPGWKVLRVLANFLHLAGFEYESIEAIRSELHTRSHCEPALFTGEAIQSDGIHVDEIPLYAVDGLVRRAAPLQKAGKQS